jgi:hypothetical protein
MEYWWNDTDSENLSTRSKVSTSATLSAIYLTWSDLGSNSGVQRDRSATNLFVFSCSLFVLFRVSFFVLIALACSCVFIVQHTTKTSMPSAGFEAAIPAREWPQAHTLDRAAKPWHGLKGENKSKL